MTGIAAGVLAVGSDVFVAAEPDFLRYIDKDGDGFPEARELVSTGYQVHMGQGGHNLSGVTLGPDGRVYWSLGDKGHYVETKEGKTFHMPNSGGVFRCRETSKRAPSGTVPRPHWTGGRASSWSVACVDAHHRRISVRPTPGRFGW